MLTPIPEKTAAEKLAALRARFEFKAEPFEDRRFASLTAEDLERLGELPGTPPDEKDAFLVRLRERLLGR